MQNKQCFAKTSIFWKNYEMNSQSFCQEKTLQSAEAQGSHEAHSSGLPQDFLSPLGTHDAAARGGYHPGCSRSLHQVPLDRGDQEPVRPVCD